MTEPNSHHPRLHLERELRDYLCNVVPVMGGRSTFGSQLDRASRFAFGCRPCLMCGGQPGIADVVEYLTDPETGKRRVIVVKQGRPERPGCGWVIAAEKGRTERQRREHRKRRELSDAARVFFESIGENPDELDPLRDTTCPSCDGFGTIPRRAPQASRGAVTARPTGSSVPIDREGGYCLAEHALRLGCLKAGRYLAQLRGLDAREGTRHALVLEVWIEHRSEVPLWLLTPSGPALVRRAGLVVDDARDLEHLLKAVDNERAAEVTSPSTERTRLLRACAEDARGLLRAAARAWNDIVPGDDADTQAEREFCKAVGL